jgi:hypothetical protein
MKLSTEETNWVKDRLNWYDIPFSEIYDEIADHILTGIEEQRKMGNKQDVKIVFQQVVDEHFGGFIGIENLAKAQEKAYKKKVKRSTWLNLKAMLNWQTNLFMAAMFIVGFYLPHTKLTAGLLMAGLVVLSFYLWLYSLWLGRFSRVQKGKRSVTDIFIARQGFLPVVVLNSLINLPNLYSFLFNGQDYQYTLVAVHPAVMTTALGVTLIYCLACIETGKKEFSIRRTV